MRSIRLCGRSFVLAALAVLGLLGGMAFVMKGGAPPLVAQPVSPPTIAPYPSYIAGTGILEASTQNIAVSTPVGGVVMEVAVKVGERVARGQELFRIDGRDLEAQLAVREAAAAAAHVQILEAGATLDQARDPLKRAEGLAPGNAISLQDLAGRRLTVQLDQAKLDTAHANADSADALVQETKINTDRLTIRAPIDGDVLQVNLRPGEYAQTGVLANPLLLLGDTRTLHVRVDIDENDAWRLRLGTPAKAFLRGNSAVAFDLTFAYVEPYVVPKTELSGASTERVDTRVLQAVYDIARGDLPIYVGQQVDVYIATPSDQTALGPPVAHFTSAGAVVPRR
ncbi:MAG TPA: efflux RND transporter periplasmic adaptor subunit [Stellaceae bacterium]|jgi:RND family efflux transporter MFP subunit|nr:efflux RND transporter periplasmic adaptor subunit [Stellaceae bacterium]